MMKIIFVTGTDTEIGKTTATVLLQKYFLQQGLRTIALKPIATGIPNEDVMLLNRNNPSDLALDIINPFSFKHPVAPHLAAEKEQKNLTVEMLVEYSKQVEQLNYDKILIEGIGGWRVPINDHETTEDWVRAMKWPVILVVGMCLGCLNHSLLTYQAIKQSGCEIVGWIANQIDKDMLLFDDNVKTLQKFIPEPMITLIRYGEWNNCKVNLRF